MLSCLLITLVLANSWIFSHAIFKMRFPSLDKMLKRFLNSGSYRCVNNNRKGNSLGILRIFTYKPWIAKLLDLVI